MNKKSMFHGFSCVFAYNFKNHTKSSKYIAVTIICSLLIIAGVITAIMLLTKPEKEVKAVSKVYVFDEANQGIPEYSELAKLSKDKSCLNAEFVKGEGTVEEFINESKEGDYVILVQTHDTNKSVLKIITSKECKASKEQIDDFGQSMVNFYRAYMYQKTGLSNEALYQVLMPVNDVVKAFGDEKKDELKDTIAMISTFLVTIIVYVMVVIYGQQVCMDVSLEKSSKLTEQLLISVSPYGLLAGKVLAIILASIIQFMVWVLAIVAGLLGGDILATKVYDLDKGPIRTGWGVLKSLFEGSDFGVASICMAILIIVAGIVLFLTLSAVAGSLVSKPEDAGSMQMVYMLPIIVCYLIVVMEAVNNKGDFSAIYHLIPFTAAFITPGVVLTGGVSLVIGGISLLLIIAAIALLIIVAGKIYHSMLFFNGAKLKFSDVVKFVFSK